MVRRSLFALIPLAILLVLLGCSSATTPSVSEVVIDQADVVLEVGQTTELSATVRAVGGASTDVDWSSGDERVATVSVEGVVTAVAVGEAGIVATSAFDDSRSASVTVTVIAAGGGDPVGVSVSVEPSAVTLEPGASQEFTATVTGASDTSVTWVASCGSIGGVTTTVEYTAPALVGECVVTATSVADSAAFADVLVSVVSGGGSTSVLRVDVDGVPGRIGGNVLVSGPDGFSERVAVASSIFSSIVPGTYEIVAFGVTDPSQDDIGYTPLVSSFLVDVEDAAMASVRVEYEEISVVASDRSRPIDADTASLLIGAESVSLRRFSLDEPLDAAGGTLRFASSSPYLDGLEVGDVITVGVTPATPQGFIGTVSSIRTEGDGSITVDAAAATLEDALVQGVAALSTTLSPSDVVSATTHYHGIEPLGVPEGMQASDVAHSFCPVASKVDLLPGSNRLELDGSLCFSLEVDFSVSVHLLRSNELSFVTTVRETADIELTGEANLPTFDRTFPLVDYTLKPITLWVGPVPVVLTPVITVSVTATGSLVAAFHTGVEQSLTFSAGLHYRDGSWEHVRPQVRPGFSYTPLTYDAGLQATVGVRPQLVLRLYGVVGPSLAMTVSVLADVTPFSRPAWRLLFGFDVRAGVEFTVLGYFGLSYDAALFSRQWQVAQGEGGLRAAPVIDSFLADPRAVHSGEATTLRWRLSGGPPESMTISPGVGNVTGRSSVTVRPTTHTTYTLTVGNDTGTVTSSTTVSVSVSAGVAVTIAPASAVLPPGGTRSFTATVAGSGDTRVTWTASCGSISGTGSTVTYTAPAAAGGCDVTATSVADPTKRASASVSVTAVQALSVSVQPPSVTLPVNGTQSFTATVTGAADPSVTWAASCGSFSGSGTTATYSAPASVPAGAPCLVRATSVEDAGAWAEAVVTIEADTIYPPPTASLTTITAGNTHSLALHTDGTVWAWGTNSYGQLGDGTTTTRLTPVQVSGLSNVTSITAAEHHSLALRSDGTVWAWGGNWDGQLGDGTTTDRLTPVQVSGLSNVTSVSAGGVHSLALRSDGTVWAWSWNDYGQLGDGTRTDRLTPVQVSGLSNVTSVSAVLYHSLALRTDGTVWAWGYNLHGQLGDGTTTDRLTPVQVSGLSNVASITAGWSHSLALRRDGTVWAWGLNNNGQLGDGTTQTRTTPVQLSGLSNVASITAGAGHSLALRRDGTVWAWGTNWSGELGDGTRTDRHTPVQVSGLTNLTSITARYHSLGLRNDGTVWAWGHNFFGQLGDGTTTHRLTPVQVSGLTNVRQP